MGGYGRNGGTVVFRGRYPHTVDEKGRLSIPSKFRELLSNRGQNTLVLTDFDAAVTAYPLDEWTRIEERIRAQSNFQQDVRAFLRVFYSSATECTVDGQGRILIPPSHRERAGLSREVMIIGVLNKFEVWSRERWEQFLQDTPVTFDEVSAKLSELGI